VRARINDEEYWVDPTRREQQGALDKLAQADFGAALVIDERSDALVQMAGSHKYMQWREVGVVVDSTAGFEQPVTYTVTTVVEGAAADSLRGTLASQSRDELQKRYLNFYASYYAGAESAGPLEVADDGAANRLTVVERYRIKEFWQRSAKHKRLEASIQTPELDEYLRKPRTRVRTSPLALAHPVDLVHVTEVRLPERWDIKPDETRIEDPAFDFQRSEAWKNQTLVLTDRFRSRRDHIAAGDVGRYVANLEKARDASSYTLYHYEETATAAPARTANGPHWSTAVIGTLALVGLLVLAMHLYRWDPEPVPRGPIHPLPPSGLGGWLAFAALSIAVSSLRVVYSLVESWPSYLTDTWLALTTPGSESYHALWMPALLFSLVANLALLVGCGLLLVLFFKRRTSVPRAFIVLLSAGFAFAVLDMVLASMIPAASKDVKAADWEALVRQGVMCVIWTLYFLRSGRVRVTFVERRAAMPRPLSAPPATLTSENAP